MSIYELDSKAAAYFDIMAQIEALTAEAEAIKDSMKAVMVEKTTEELEGHGWRATWHNTNTSRFDSKKFKALKALLVTQLTALSVRLVAELAQ